MESDDWEDYPWSVEALVLDNSPHEDLPRRHRMLAKDGFWPQMLEIAWQSYGFIALLTPDEAISQYEMMARDAYARLQDEAR